MGRPRGLSTRNWFLHSASSFGGMLASKTAKPREPNQSQSKRNGRGATHLPPPCSTKIGTHPPSLPPSLPRTHARTHQPRMRLFRTDRVQGSPLSFSSLNVSSKSAVKCSRSSNRCSGGIFRLRRNLRLSRPPALGRTHVADPTRPIPRGRTRKSPTPPQNGTHELSAFMFAAMTLAIGSLSASNQISMAFECRCALAASHQALAWLGLAWVVMIWADALASTAVL